MYIYRKKKVIEIKHFSVVYAKYSMLITNIDCINDKKTILIWVVSIHM